DTDECGVRVSPGLSRRTIFPSWVDGRPYGVARMGAPSVLLHRGTLGGRLLPSSSASARSVPSAAPAAITPPPSAAARRRNARRAGLPCSDSGAARILPGFAPRIDIVPPVLCRPPLRVAALARL